MICYTVFFLIGKLGKGGWRPRLATGMTAPRGGPGAAARARAAPRAQPPIRQRLHGMERSAEAVRTGQLEDSCPVSAAYDAEANLDLDAFVLPRSQPRSASGRALSPARASQRLLRIQVGAQARIDVDGTENSSSNSSSSSSGNTLLPPAQAQPADAASAAAAPLPPQPQQPQQPPPLQPQEQPQPLPLPAQQLQAPSPPPPPSTYEGASTYELVRALSRASVHASAASSRMQHTLDHLNRGVPLLSPAPVGAAPSPAGNDLLPVLPMDVRLQRRVDEYRAVFAASLDGEGHG